MGNRKLTEVFTGGLSRFGTPCTNNSRSDISKALFLFLPFFISRQGVQISRSRLDLNPIEIMWSILGRSISDRRCNTKAELWECVQQAWYKLASSILTKLVESMPRRLHAVTDNKGAVILRCTEALEFRR